MVFVICIICPVKRNNIWLLCIHFTCVFQYVEPTVKLVRQMEHYCVIPTVVMTHLCIMLQLSHVLVSGIIWQLFKQQNIFIHLSQYNYFLSQIIGTWLKTLITFYRDGCLITCLILITHWLWLVDYFIRVGDFFPIRVDHFFLKLLQWY